MNQIKGLFLRALKSRRSVVVMMFGVTFILIGSSYLGQVGQVKASPAAQMAYKAHLELMGLDAWGWLFILGGGLAIASGIAFQHVVGFTALMAVAGLWGIEFIASWVSTGYDRAIVGALTWLLLAGLLMVISGWPDPRKENCLGDLFGGDQ